MAERNTKTSMTYDPKTGSWVPSTYTDTSQPASPEPKPKVEPSPAPSNSNPKSKVDSKKKADKEYIEAEFNTLTGDMTLTATEKSIRIKVNDTVRIEGLGKYLSGLYFVTSIRRTLSKDGGYSHTLSLLKNGFGNSIKSGAKSEEVARKPEVTPKSTEIKVGDSVKIVGDNAVYSNAHDGVKVPKWVKKKTHTIRQVSKDGTRVLLREINSWTYIKFIQKV